MGHFYPYLTKKGVDRYNKKKKDISKKIDVPPFVIFQDPSLEDMATRYPINLDELKAADSSSLNANQLKLIELNTIIENYEQYMIKVAQIFFAFILIGLIPYFVAWTRLLIQRKKKKN